MTGTTLIERAAFVADVREAAATRRPFAAGKIGFGEQRWLYLPILQASGATPTQIRAHTTVLRFDAERQAGIFPSDAAFLDRFVAWHAGHVVELDCLGLFGSRLERPIISHHGIKAKLIHYGDTQPDRSVPSRDEQCYLPAFADRKVLLVTPFAGLLRSRATADTFEAVWAKSGKRWFAPHAVEALEFPYGYAGADHGGFASCIDLFDDITRRMDRIDYDIALIGAGCLGIPLAVHARRRGRVGLSLGGYLQVLFGVLGRRWRDDEAWQRKHINDAWIDMPAAYHPPGKDMLTDGGAYW